MLAGTHKKERRSFIKRAHPWEACTHFPTQNTLLPSAHFLPFYTLFTMPFSCPTARLYHPEWMLLSAMGFFQLVDLMKALWVDIMRKKNKVKSVCVCVSVCVCMWMFVGAEVAAATKSCWKLYYKLRDIRSNKSLMCLPQGSRKQVWLSGRIGHTHNSSANSQGPCFP